jgi:hypothetical protein
MGVPNPAPAVGVEGAALGAAAVVAEGEVVGAALATGALLMAGATVGGVETTGAALVAGGGTMGAALVAGATGTFVLTLGVGVWTSLAGSSAVSPPHAPLIPNIETNNARDTLPKHGISVANRLSPRNHTFFTRVG